MNGYCILILIDILYGVYLLVYYKIFLDKSYTSLINMHRVRRNLYCILFTNTFDADVTYIDSVHSFHLVSRTRRVASRG